MVKNYIKDIDQFNSLIITSGCLMRYNVQTLTYSINAYLISKMSII